MLSDHDEIRLKINNKKIIENSKHSKHCGSKRKFKRKLENSLNQIKIKIQHIKIYGTQDRVVLQEKGKTLNAYIRKKKSLKSII